MKSKVKSNKYGARPSTCSTMGALSTIIVKVTPYRGPSSSLVCHLERYTKEAGFKADTLSLCLARRPRVFIPSITALLKMHKSSTIGFLFAYLWEKSYRGSNSSAI